MRAQIEFDGQVLRWNGVQYKGTTGLKGYQTPSQQCKKDAGPVPEGLYTVLLRDKGTAKDDGSGQCRLEPAWGLQTIPRGSQAGDCEPYWANWGQNRVRFEPADIRTRHACTPLRGGFYIHDSAKGFSHGCIEVQAAFFPALRNFVKMTKQATLLLQVKYVPNRQTNGGTRA
jgi:hypothetical protein